MWQGECATCWARSGRPAGRRVRLAAELYALFMCDGLCRVDYGRRRPKWIAHWGMGVSNNRDSNLPTWCGIKGRWRGKTPYCEAVRQSEGISGKFVLCNSTAYGFTSPTLKWAYENVRAWRMESAMKGYHPIFVGILCSPLVIFP